MDHRPMDHSPPLDHSPNHKPLDQGKPRTGDRPPMAWARCPTGEGDPGNLPAGEPPDPSPCAPAPVTLGPSPGLSLWATLHRVHHHWLTWLRDYLQPWGLNPTQWEVLVILAQEPDLSLTALAHRLGLRKASITPLVRDLETLGWVERQGRSDHQRGLALRLTPQGQQQFAQCFPRYRDALQAHFSHWDTPELELLRLLLRKLEQSFGPHP
jgi:DNA-binding MarR family transcriptional regulator